MTICLHILDKVDFIPWAILVDPYTRQGIERYIGLILQLFRDGYLSFATCWIPTHFFCAWYLAATTCLTSSKMRGLCKGNHSDCKRYVPLSSLVDL
jgi:hypothetical protein